MKAKIILKKKRSYSIQIDISHKIPHHYKWLKEVLNNNHLERYD